ncbi:methyl-accepting chemotaxis protein [Candidatus Vampirococcus lugosii]|uniref:Methyl-accepting chemotaxis protein (MCP) n=1 Tax=Candidatus Vampirococcus lugosii TaxID=2789015 RepID=A0ABS5QM75_9BACT|nr:methyl-accepting chemotaxis protein [Candidatus Vampirococcus lugosii]MBS8122064.1 Methyl-accepting chemotaxis protein (MCP) [Candidatus Vampirococcus lugosii]
MVLNTLSNTKNISNLKEELEETKLQRDLAYSIFDVLKSEGIFVVEDLETGIIVKSNAIGRKIIYDATGVNIIDGKTSMHDFHKTPKRSATKLSNLKPGDSMRNATVPAGDRIVGSSSNVIEIGGKKYYIGIFTDITSEVKEINHINKLRESLMSLYELIEYYSELGISLKMTSGMVELSKNGVINQKDFINSALQNSLNKLNEDLALFSSVVGNNEKVQEISKQIKIISINGSIEAARIGDEGKGFSVIANETREISELAGNLVQGSIKDLNKSIEKSKLEAEKIESNIGDLINDNTIQDELDTILSNVDKLLTNLSSKIGGMNTILHQLISDLRNFYHEKLEGLDLAISQIEIAKFEHLMFIIKFNNFILGQSDFEVSDHKSCNLGKFLYSGEIEPYMNNLSKNGTYQNLLSEHEEFHSMAKAIKDKIDKYSKSPDLDLLKEIYDYINTDLNAKKEGIIKHLSVLTDELK